MLAPVLSKLGPLRQKPRLGRAWERAREEVARACLTLFHAVCARPAPGRDADSRLYTSLRQALDRLALEVLPAEPRVTLPAALTSPTWSDGCLLWPETSEAPAGRVLRVRRLGFAGGHAELVVAAEQGEGPPGYALDAKAPGLLSSLLGGKDDAGRFLERVLALEDESLAGPLRCCRERLEDAARGWRAAVEQELCAALEEARALPAGLRAVVKALGLEVIGEAPVAVPEQRREPASLFADGLGRLRLEHAEEERGAVLEVLRPGLRRAAPSELPALLLPADLRVSLGTRPSAVEELLRSLRAEHPAVQGRLDAVRRLPLDQRDGLPGRELAVELYADLERAAALPALRERLRAALVLLGLRPYPAPSERFRLAALDEPGARLEASEDAPRGQVLRVERQAFLWKGCLLGEPRFVLSTGPEDGLARVLRVLEEEGGPLPAELPALRQTLEDELRARVADAGRAFPASLMESLVRLLCSLPEARAALRAALEDQLRMRGLEILVGDGDAGCEIVSEEYSALPAGATVRVLRRGFRYLGETFQQARIVRSRGPLPPLRAGWERWWESLPESARARLQPWRERVDAAGEALVPPLLALFVELSEAGEPGALGGLAELLREGGVELLPGDDARALPLSLLGRPDWRLHLCASPEPEGALLAVRQRGYRWRDERRPAVVELSRGPDPLVPLAVAALAGEPLSLATAEGAVAVGLPAGAAAPAGAWLARPPPREPEAGALFLFALRGLCGPADRALEALLDSHLARLGARVVPAHAREPLPSVLWEGCVRGFAEEVPEGCLVGPYQPGLAWGNRWLVEPRGRVSLGPPSPLLRRLHAWRAAREQDPPGALRSRLLRALGESLAELEALPRASHTEWPGVAALIRVLDACDGAEASGEPRVPPPAPEPAAAARAGELIAWLGELGARVDPLRPGEPLSAQPESFPRTPRPVFDKSPDLVLGIVHRAVVFREATFRATTELWVGAGRRPHILAQLERFALEARMAGIRDEALDTLVGQARDPDAHALHFRVIEAVNLLYRWSAEGRAFARGAELLHEFLHGILGPLGYRLKGIEPGSDFASLGNQWLEPRFVHEPGATGHSIVRVVRPAFADGEGEVVQRALVEVAR